LAHLRLGPHLRRPRILPLSRPRRKIPLLTRTPFLGVRLALSAAEGRLDAALPRSPQSPSTWLVRGGQLLRRLFYCNDVISRKGKGDCSAVVSLALLFPYRRPRLVHELLRRLFHPVNFPHMFRKFSTSSSVSPA